MPRCWSGAWAYVSTVSTVPNVEEYCVSEGWVRLAVGKTVDRHGNAMTVKYKGKVEPYLR